MLSISAKKLLSWKKKQLDKGGNNQSLSVLLEAIGGVSNDKLNYLIINPDCDLYLKKDLDIIETIWDNHLLNSVPIQYICGFSFWRNLKLKVSDKVLIPRSETELIIDIIHEKFVNKSRRHLFAELGTGSGAISIALAVENPQWDGIATDIDENALEIASINFLNSCSQKNLKFCCGHWWNPLENFKGKLDFVVSNPPYIPIDTYENLPNEVKNYEPKVALLGGEDGLNHIREIIKYAPLYLKEKGWLILENHFDQGARVKQIFINNRFTSVEVIKDLSGIGRFTIGRYK